MELFVISDAARKVAQIASYYKTYDHKKGGNYTKLEAEGAYENGTLGELYFYKLLKERYISGMYGLNVTGKADAGDFVLFSKTKPWSIDVKTACKDYHKKIMIPSAQYALYQHTIYVGAKLNKRVCEIYGYNWGVDGMTVENPGVLAYTKPLNELSDIEELLANADKGPAEYSIWDNEKHPMSDTDKNIIKSWLDNPV